MIGAVPIWVQVRLKHLEFGDGQARRGGKPKEGDTPEEEGVKLAEQAQLLKTTPEGSIVEI